MAWAAARYRRFHFYCDRGLLTPRRPFLPVEDELRLVVWGEPELSLIVPVLIRPAGDHNADPVVRAGSDQVRRAVRDQRITEPEHHEVAARAAEIVCRKKRPFRLDVRMPEDKLVESLDRELALALQFPDTAGLIAEQDRVGGARDRRHRGQHDHER